MHELRVKTRLDIQIDSNSNKHHLLNQQLFWTSEINTIFSDKLEMGILLKMPLLLPFEISKKNYKSKNPNDIILSTFLASFSMKTIQVKSKVF